jgi:hypothetical protein
VGWSVLSLYLLTYGLVRGGEHGFTAAPVRICQGVAAFAACVFVVVEARAGPQMKIKPEGQSTVFRLDGETPPPALLRRRPIPLRHPTES